MGLIKGYDTILNEFSMQAQAIRLLNKTNREKSKCKANAINSKRKPINFWDTDHFWTSPNSGNLKIIKGISSLHKGEWTEHPLAQ